MAVAGELQHQFECIDNIWSHSTIHTTPNEVDCEKNLNHIPFKPLADDVEKQITSGSLLSEDLALHVPHKSNCFQGMTIEENEFSSQLNYDRKKQKFCVKQYQAEGGMECML